MPHRLQSATLTAAQGRALLVAADTPNARATVALLVAAGLAGREAVQLTLPDDYDRAGRRLRVRRDDGRYRVIRLADVAADALDAVLAEPRVPGWWRGSWTRRTEVMIHALTETRHRAGVRADGAALRHLAIRTAWNAATPEQVGAYFGVYGMPLARGTADYGIPAALDAVLGTPCG
ncbi:hypothetical protein JJV70_02125 [Streptomyces sp. JJ66]|uniref:hypothetical protein n=1 Tax=Streptomyces sp. JJ66 TaxID=2803843 RepID=UPI001C584E1B|nr:hypothetical protein [Streptomyces sp. JJ66]MBW1600918.1 hypothetical protein [Streptomyces sp. JJ66]